MSQDKDLAAGKADRSAGRKNVDWEAVERDYRAGILTFDKMAEIHGVTKGRISQVAKNKKWPRDLAAKIQAQVQDRLNREALNRELNKDACLASEREIVDANAEVQTRIILGHRKDVPRARNLMTKLLEELEGSVDARADLEQIGEILAGGDEAKMADLYRKLMSLPGRIDSGKKLAEALRVCVQLEREVFNIGGERTPGQTLDEFLDAIS